MPVIYLNSANLSLCRPRVLETMTRYQRAFEQNPTEELQKAWGHLWKAQSRLAGFLGADVHTLSLRTNVTKVNGPPQAFLLPQALQPRGEQLVADLLHKYHVQIHARRLGGQRYAVLSPHFYNKEEEIREAIQWLATWQ